MASQSTRFLRGMARRPLSFSWCSSSRWWSSQVQVRQVRREEWEAGAEERVGALMEAAAFVAVDAEMTGMAAAPWREAFEWDSARVRFLKLRHSASRFALLQFGICPFVPQPQDGCLVAHPHTFHLAPHRFHDLFSAEDDSDSADPDLFLCQTSSLRFLAAHRLDFDASLRHGVPLCPRAGFPRLIRLLSSLNRSHGTLLVAHNGILDLAHMHHKCLGPLPPSLPRFLARIHRAFPNLVDTKHLLSTQDSPLRQLMRNTSRSLSSAFSFLCSSPDRIPIQLHTYHHHHQGRPQRSSSFNSGAKHDAGYDAYMTGSVFAQSCFHLGVNLDQFLSNPSTPHPLHSNVKLKPFLNHLYPTWNSGTVLDFASGTEKPEVGNYKHKFPKIVYENIVLIWGFPSTLNCKILRGCLTKVFGPDSVVSLFFIDSTAALLQFTRNEYVKDFFALKERLERQKHDSVSVLHPLSVIFEGGNTKAGDYSTYEDIIACNKLKVLFKDQADASGVAYKVDVMRQSRANGEE